jgi:serine protease
MDIRRPLVKRRNWKTMRGAAAAALSAGLIGWAGVQGAGASPVPAPDPDAETAQALAQGDALSELVVDLADDVTEAEAAALAARHGVRLVPVSSYVTQDRIYRAQVLPGAADRPGLLRRALAALRREGRVEAADLALVYRVPESSPTSLTPAAEQALPVPAHKAQDSEKVFPNDPKYKYQWHLDQLHMPTAWRLAQGEGVTVAVVDTGVTRVEDLQGTEFVPGRNFVANNDDASDDHGHGTHVAGTIAQTTHNGVGVAGVAYKARIMPIKVLSGSGSGSVGGIAEGIRWAVDHGAQVINMSLGGPFNSQVLAKAVKYANERGVVVVCAAGNDGRGKVSFPAANAGAIAVAATQYDEATTFYSNWGREIAVAAPGGNTRLDQNGDGVPDGVMQNTVVPGNIQKQDYLLFMGTSMASPHVAGVAALLVGAGVKSPAEVERILKASARRPAHYRGKHDDHYGAGIVDATAALRLAQGQAVAARRPCGPTSSDAPVGMGLGLMMMGAGLLFLGLRRRSLLINP